MPRRMDRLRIFLRATSGIHILGPMNSFLCFLPLAAALALVGAGCTTMPEANAPAPASQADVTYLREELRRMNTRLDAAAAELGRVQGDIVTAQSARPDMASAAQVSALQTQLDDLQRQIRALDAARVQDKKEIYDDISKKIATLLKSAPTASGAARPAKPRSGSQTGIEHVVQPGETLSKIASAYGKKMQVIMDENGLKNADSIFVGQKLFIPD